MAIDVVRVKINTCINPGDLNAKRHGGERRSCLGKRMGLHQPYEAEKNDDSAVRHIKRLNRATKEQCVRLILTAGLTMGMRVQLKGCVQGTLDNLGNNDSNGSINDGPNDVQMVLWTVLTLR